MTFKRRLCLVALVCALMLGLSACDFRLMSKREVENQLEEWYGQEFVVRSSKSITDDYYMDDIWCAKVYIVSPKDDPDIFFYSFNVVEGESFGVPGFRNWLSDTYAADIIGAVFKERAADAGIEYELDYTYPVKSSSKYHSHLWITIDPVFPEDLTEVCELLSQTFADALEKIPRAEGRSTEAGIKIQYRETDWPDEDFCSIWIEPFSQLYWNETTKTHEWISIGADAEIIRECIMKEVDSYKSRRE